MKRQSAALLCAALLSAPIQAQTLAEFRYSYMRSCIDEEGKIRGRKAPHPYCSCTYEAISDNMTLKEFEALEARFKHRNTVWFEPLTLKSEKFPQAMARCNAIHQ